MLGEICVSDPLRCRSNPVVHGVPSAVRAPAPRVAQTEGARGRALQVGHALGISDIIWNPFSEYGKKETGAARIREDLSRWRMCRTPPNKSYAV